MSITTAFILGIVSVIVFAVMVLAILAFFKVLRLNKDLKELNNNLVNNVNELFGSINSNFEELNNSIQNTKDEIYRTMDSRFNKFETKIKG